MALLPNHMLPSMMREMAAPRKWYWGEDLAEELVQWLAQAVGSRSYSRVVSLISTLREAEDAARRAFPSTKAAKSVPVPRNEPEATVHFAEIQKRLDELLSAYRFTPNLFYDYRRSGGWKVRFFPVPRTRGYPAKFATAKSYGVPGKVGYQYEMTVLPFVEADAVLALLRLAAATCLDRLQQCDQCKNWFFARFSHQRFCRTKCQQAHYRSSEDWKVHRREWMSNYRNIQRSGAVK